MILNSGVFVCSFLKYLTSLATANRQRKSIELAGSKVINFYYNCLCSLEYQFN